MNRRKALKETYLPSYFEGYGKKGLNLFELAKELHDDGKTLTLDTDYLKRGFKHYNYLMTPFKEIKNMPMDKKVHKDRLSILDKQEDHTGTFDEIILELKEAIKSYIVSVWNSKKKKLFLHSAGYDSRIISGVLMELDRDWETI